VSCKKWLCSLFLFAMAAAPAVAQVPVHLVHVHGLTYSADGKRLMIPSHHGLAVYESGRWSKAPGPQHDYMGFAGTAQSLYSSGHPAPGSGLVNPFGLIRSRDGGKTWQKLGLEGETDFHLLATSWHTNAIYVWNPAPSSRIPRAGLHYTVNDGFTWTAATGTGLLGDPQAVAVHPDGVRTVAIATSNGVFLSRDAGSHFVAVPTTGEGVSVFFDLDGKHLWSGTFDNSAHLTRTPLSGGKPSNVKLPPLGRDAVAYIAQHPNNRSEYAIATFGRSVYISKNSGSTWMQIAQRGDTK
jgi:hypothetical protein